MALEPPKEAKKVYSGKWLDVFRWQQKLYDGTFATYEMVVRVPAADVIATVGEKIIIGMQEQAGQPLFPSIPGGLLEPGEDPEEGGRRELLEESGYACDRLQLARKYDGYNRIVFEKYLFIARDCKKIAEQKLDGGEKIEVKLIDFDTFIQLCRNIKFKIPEGYRMEMYEALLNPAKKEKLRKEIFG
jgi:ADP-ribose pyrophosphatase